MAYGELITVSEMDDAISAQEEDIAHRHQLWQHRIREIRTKLAKNDPHKIGYSPSGSKAHKCLEKNGSF